MTLFCSPEHEFDEHCTVNTKKMTLNQPTTSFPSLTSRLFLTPDTAPTDQPKFQQRTLLMMKNILPR